MQESSDTPAADGEPPARRSTMTVIALVAVAILVRTYFAASAATSAALPWIMAMIVCWASCLLVIVRRSPRRELRFSEPAVLILAWAAYYFILPAISWLSGSAFDLEGTVALTSDRVAQAQQMHILFLLSLIGVYRWLLPRFAIRPLRADQLEQLPRAHWWILVGLAPVALELVMRLMETGTIRPETAYLDAMSDLQENVDSAKASGGSNYLLTQVLTKLRFYGSMTIGFGLSLYLVRAWRRKQWWRVILFHAAFPVLLYLSVGSRSVVAFPFIIALIVTDQLAGPISWKYIISLALAGFLFFYLYGFFRMYQDEELGAAIADAAADLGESRELDLAEAENSLMLMKEAYAIEWVEQHGADGIGHVLRNALLLPIPQQVSGDKEETLAERLARALLGDRLFESGFALAGSLVAEGYFADGPLGVVLMGALLGALVAGGVRLLSSAQRREGAPLWKIILLATFTSQAVMVIRSELGLLISYYLYYVFLPMAVAYVLLTKIAPRAGARWRFAIFQLD